MTVIDEITKNYNSEVFYERVKDLVKNKKEQNLGNFLHDIGINLYSYYSLQKQNNFPRADVAQRIADALGVSLDFLVTGKDRDSGMTTEELETRAFPFGEDVRKILNDLFSLEPDQRDLLLYTLAGQIKYFQDRNKNK